MKRLLCYAHFDGNGGLKPFVKHALDSVSSCCSTILFVSNSPLPEKEVEYLRSICQHVQVNRNIGYDFTMWKTALQQVDYSEYDEVVLMNSSVYGPLVPLEPIFQEMAGRECDFWGVTECFQHQPHVQSYFLVFKEQVVRSAQFRAFWDSVLPYVDKTQIILNYEVGLSVWLREAGFRMDAYYNFARIGHLLLGEAKRLERDHNTSVKNALDLVKWGSPFLKVEPVRNGWITKAMVATEMAACGYPLEYLDAHEDRGDDSCPVCGGGGKFARKVRNYFSPRDTGSYSYKRCLNRRCGVMWLPAPPAVRPPVPVCDEASPLETGKRSVLSCAFFKVLDRLAGLREGRRNLFLHGLDRGKPGTVLEIGSGHGERLRALKACGWRVLGLDPKADPGVVSALREEGIEVVTEGEPGTDCLPPSHFDAVIVSALMEEVDPVLLLKRTLALLKPGGKIYLSTPNSGALTHRFFGRYWIGIGAPRNVVLFNRKALKTLLRDAGYTDVTVKTVSCNAEIYALHSFDAAYYRLTHPYTTSRIGNEMQPLVVQFLSSLINAITRDVGDDCVAVASKAG